MYYPNGMYARIKACFIPECGHGWPLLDFNCGFGTAGWQWRTRRGVHGWTQKL